MTSWHWLYFDTRPRNAVRLLYTLPIRWQILPRISTHYCVMSILRAFFRLQWKETRKVDRNANKCYSLVNKVGWCYHLDKSSAMPLEICKQNINIDHWKLTAFNAFQENLFDNMMALDETREELQKMMKWCENDQGSGFRCSGMCKLLGRDKLITELELIASYWITEVPMLWIFWSLMPFTTLFS